MSRFEGLLCHTSNFKNKKITIVAFLFSIDDEEKMVFPAALPETPIEVHP